MFKPTWIITIGIVIAVILGGLYFMPVHKLTVHVTVNGIPVNGAGVDIDGVYLNTAGDGDAVFYLTIGSRLVVTVAYGDTQTQEVTINLFDLDKTLVFTFERDI